MIHANFSMQVAKTSTYPVMCPFPLVLAQCDHNPPMLQMDRHTLPIHQMSHKSSPSPPKKLFPVILLTDRQTFPLLNWQFSVVVATFFK